MTDLTRRNFLRLLLVGSAVPLTCTAPRSKRVFRVPGQIANPSSAAHGHLLRSAATRAASVVPASGEWLDVVVVGGGVSGLSACWKLKRSGVQRIQLLELEGQLGGTSAAGSQAGRRFPWGAHYINIPPREADCVHEVLVDLEVITGYDAAGRPRVNLDYLLKWPRERLFMNGGWQEGLSPFADASAGDQEVLQQFEDDMLRWALYEGRDGRRGFAMPLAYSSTDSAVRELDDITMLDYLRSRGWNSSRLDWLVNYACRDDYGALLQQVSAWAGIHYFSCRFYDRRVADDYPSDTLTWEEGNSFLTDRLARRLSAEEIRLGKAVVAIRPVQGGAEVAYVDLASGDLAAVRTRTVVYAGKLHTAPLVVAGLPQAQRQAMSSLIYSPWLVAAVLVSRLPETAASKPAWENVLYDSPSVGYVVSDHQGRGSDHLPGSSGSALVYYLPFSEDPEGGRKELLSRPHEHWVNVIMNDLIEVHPDLDKVVERIDVYRWGHAMIRPAPGCIWGEQSRMRRQSFGPVSFATCDATGLPLFEEAVFTGIQAAERCLDLLDLPYATSVRGLRHD
jgi:glycine/D-amino acid oxidase-like deaminating enzyme